MFAWLLGTKKRVFRNRRAEIRHPAEGLLKVTWKDCQTAAWLRDLSLGGVCLSVNRKFLRPGMTVTVGKQAPGRQQLNARVAWVRCSGVGQEAGLQGLGDLGGTWVHEWLRSRLDSLQRDRRKHTRVNVRYPVRWEDPLSGMAGRTVTVDVSLGGLRLPARSLPGVGFLRVELAGHVFLARVVSHCSLRFVDVSKREQRVLEQLMCLGGSRVVS